MYAKIENGAVSKFPYSYEDLKRENPQTSWPTSMPIERLNEYGIHIVVAKGQPEYDASTHKVVDSIPTWNAVKKQWEQAFNVVPLSAEELKARVPQSVTMRQARLALHRSGLFETIVAAVNAAGEEVKIEWEYASEVQRNSSLVSTLSSAIGIPDEQLDNLFVLAGSL